MTLNTQHITPAPSCAAPVSPPLSYDAQTGEKFLAALMGKDGGYYEFRCFWDGFTSEDKPFRKWIQRPGEERDFIAKQVQDGNQVYIGVAARQKGQGGKAGCILARWVHADLDFKDSSEAQARARLAAYPIQPDMMVSSGGGLHCWWHIQPLALPENQERVEAVNRAFVQDLGADDAAVDVSRILRLPGTWNMKPNYAEPRPVFLEKCELPAAPRRIEDFRAAPKERKIAPPSEKKSLAYYAVTLPENDILSKAVSAKNGARAARLFGGDWSEYGSQSQADIALCGALAFYAGPHGQQAVDALFRNSGLMRDKWDERHAGDGRTYGEMTLDKIFAERVTWYEAPGPMKLRTPAAPTAPAAKNNSANIGGIENEAPAESEAAPVCEAMQSDAGEEETETDAPDVPATLEIILRQCEAQINRNGANVMPCGILFPPGMDREDIEKIGGQIKKAESNAKTVLNFWWGDWYNSLPTQKGARNRIVADLYGYPFRSFEAKREQDRISGLASVARRVPQEKRRYDRLWSFWESLASFPEERQTHWLAQPLRKGIMREIEAERLANMEPRRASEDAAERAISGGTSARHDTPSNVNTDIAPETDSNLSRFPGKNPETDSINNSVITVSVSAEMAQLLETLQAQAAYSGLTPEMMLRQFLNREATAQAPEPAAPPTHAVVCAAPARAETPADEPNEPNAPPAPHEELLPLIEAAERGELPGGDYRLRDLAGEMYAFGDMNRFVKRRWENAPVNPEIEYDLLRQCAAVPAIQAEAIAARNLKT